MIAESPPAILKLRSDVLCTPRRLDLVEIEAAMLFPDCAGDRQQVLRAAQVEDALENRAAYGDTYLAGLLYKSAKTLPLELIQAKAKERFIKGMIVGLVLHNQIAYACLGRSDVTKGELIRDATKPFQKTKGGGYLRISPKTFNNDVWPTFHCVAHLWAASLAANVLHAYPNGAFPCRIDALAQFLADAETYRIKGETTRARQAPTTILDPTETIKLPVGFRLEPSILAFEPRFAA